ncbi:MAG TPA: transglycosylase SLT domain-containing protein [Paludibacter sp.]|nr:transglycosylase SLT domain-containing protein [Paludibacter sp.]
MLLYEEKIHENKAAFVEKVKAISSKLGINPNWLMFCMNLETAGTMSHTITNSIGAIGLIQFLPSTAKALGTTTALLRQMTNVEQLDYVYKYLKTYVGKYNDFTDVYSAIFYPAFIGKPDTYVVTSDTVARQNPLFDTNKDLDISKLELKNKLMSMVPAAWKSEILKKK